MNQEKGIELLKFSPAQRVALFDKKLEELQKIYGVKIYACQQVLQPSGEIVNLIKIVDILSFEEGIHNLKKV